MKRTIIIMGFSLLISLFFFSELRADISNPDLKESFYLGRYYLQVGQLEQAISNYEELIQNYPRTREAEEAWMNLGGIYVSLLKQKQEELEAALLEAEKTGVDNNVRSLQTEVINLRNQAIKTYQTVVNRFPDSAGSAMIRIGRIYVFHSSGLEEDGRNMFQKVINGFPEESGRAALLLGDSYSHQGKYEEAKTAYHQAGYKFPEVSARARILISRLDQKLDNFSAAVNVLNPSLNIIGGDGLFTEYRFKGSIMQEAIELIAENMIAEGNSELAIERLKNVIADHPNTNVGLRTTLYLAGIYQQEGDQELFREVLDSVVDDYPQSIYAVKAYLQKANAVSDEESVNIYNLLREKFPRSKFWVSTTIKLSRLYLAMAEKAEEDKEKNDLRSRAGIAVREIIKNYPFSPQAEQAKNFLKTNQL